MDKTSAPGSDTTSAASTSDRKIVNVRRLYKQNLSDVKYASVLLKLKGGFNSEYTIMDNTDSPNELILDILVTEYEISNDSSNVKKREISFLDGQVYEESLYFEDKIYVGQKINTEYNMKPKKVYVCDISAGGIRVTKIDSHGAYHSGDFNKYTITVSYSTTPPTVEHTIVEGNGEKLDFDIARGLAAGLPYGVKFEYIM